MIIVDNNKGLRQTINRAIQKTAPVTYERNLQKHILLEDQVAKPKIEQLIKESDSKYFSRVEIETINRCNNHCQFCPVHAGADPREFSIMSDDTFTKIINDLKQMDYCGYIALFSNNEPLLDRKLIERIAYAHKELPLAFHYLYTNGTLLNEEKFLGLSDYLNLLIVDNYNSKMLPDVKLIYDKYKDDDRFKDRVIIQMRRSDEILSNRGGQAENRLPVKSLSSSCIMPFKQLIIRPTGEVSLCCNDVFGKYTMGNVNRQSLKEIWHSPEYQHLRNKIKISRVGLDLCKDCDVLYSTLKMF